MLPSIDSLLPKVNHLQFLKVGVPRQKFDLDNGTVNSVVSYRRDAAGAMTRTWHVHYIIYSVKLSKREWTRTVDSCKESARRSRAHSCTTLQFRVYSLT